LALLRLFNGAEADLFPVTINWLDNFVMWPSDLADTVEREFVAALGVQGREKFEDIQNHARAECGNAGDLNKNAVYIGSLLAMLKDAGVTSTSLDRLCDRILSFGA
jgi:putative ATP-dependent endonuclease of the OLD family